MKKTFTSILMLLALTILLTGASCTKNKNVNTNAPIAPPLGNDIGMDSSEVVELYMHFTLGSIPGASVDYDEAKKYLTDDLKAQFTNPMFVPTSYCMQDGPDDVRIASDDLGGGSIEVVVEGQYGGTWQEMWQFSLVPDKPNLSWLISEIKCLNE